MKMRILLLLPMSILLLGASCYQKVDSENRPISNTLSGEGKELAAESYVQAGFGHLRTQNYTLAEQRFERALKIKPGFYLANMGLALLYATTEQWDLANSTFAKSLKAAPDDTDVLNNYGQYLCQRGELERASELLLKSAEDRFNPNPQVPYTNLAVCMIGADRATEAEEYLVLALRTHPNFAQALLPLGKLLFDRGEVAEARNYLQRYEEVAQHSPLSLWLGLQIEHRLGSKEGVETYKFLLRKRFPDSEEARQLSTSGI